MKKRRTKTALLWLISVLVPLMQPRQPVEAANMQGILLGQGAYEEATDDWETMLERLDAAIANGKGENVNFSAGNRFTVPEGILEKMSGKNATLGLHTSNGVTFSVSGMDVTAADGPINMEVIFDAEIPEDAVDKIFRKFYQADESHSSEGNGVGLVIVKRVVELHRGFFASYSSMGVTAFEVKLPKA